MELKKYKIALQVKLINFHLDFFLGIGTGWAQFGRFSLFRLECQFFNKEDVRFCQWFMSQSIQNETSSVQPVFFNEGHKYINIDHGFKSATSFLKNCCDIVMSQGLLRRLYLPPCFFSTIIPIFYTMQYFYSLNLIKCGCVLIHLYYASTVYYTLSVFLWRC